MKGLLLIGNAPYYTNMYPILTPIKKQVLQYHWLVTDCQCNHHPDNRLVQGTSWLSGEDLFSIVSTHEIQFIWAVFSAFPKSISKADVLSYPLPFADGYKGFWHNPLSLQHPLAKIEIVPWDSTLALIISQDDLVINLVKKAFPFSQNLQQYNNE